MSTKLGFFQESDSSLSMSRLCMFLGTVGGIAYALINITPDWRVVVAIMFCGCLPYIFNKANEMKNKLMKNPELIQKIADILKKNA